MKQSDERPPAKLNHELLVERSRRLEHEIQEFGTELRSIEADLAALISDISSIEGFRVQETIRLIEDRFSELSQHLDQVDHERQQLLTDWEESAIFFATSEEDRPALSAKIGTLEDGVFNEVDRKLRKRQGRLVGASQLRRMLSKEHQRRVSELSVHQEVMNSIRQASGSLQTEAGATINDQRTQAERAKRRVFELVADKMNRIVEQEVAQIKGGQMEVYALAEESGFLTEVNQLFFETEIQPVVEELRASFSSVELRSLVDEWAQAAQELLVHGVNDFIDRERLAPQELHGDRVFTYGNKIDVLNDKIDQGFPRHPSKSWEFVNPEDAGRSHRLRLATEKVKITMEGSPTKRISALVKLFADWRAHRTFDATAPSYERVGVKVGYYRDRRLSNDSFAVLKNTSALLEMLTVLNRWKSIRENPKFADKAEAKDMDAFEEYLIHKLVDDIIRPGGRESWDGTYAIDRLERMNSPKVLIPLMEYIMYANSGHSTVVAYKVIEEIARSPEGQAYIAQLPAIQRDLFAQMLNPDSVLNTTIKETTQEVYAQTAALARGEFFLARTQLLELLSTEKQYQYWNQAFAFIGGWMPDQDAVELLLEKRPELEDKVFQQREYAPWWTINGLLPALAENQEFVDRVLTDALGGEDTEKVGELLGHKEYKRSSSIRAAVLHGALTLRARGVEGQRTMADIMDRFRGSKDDPARLRKLFRMVEVLDRFGDDEGPFDPSERIAQIDATLENISGFLPKAGREPRKELVRRQRSLEIERGRLTGLAGIVEAYQGRIANRISQRLHVDADVGQQFAEQIETHAESGLIDIATTLQLSFEAKKVDRPQSTLRQVVTHVVKGDFQQWKYEHPYAKEQLRFLEQDVSIWKQNEESVVVGEDSSGDILSGQVSAALRLLGDGIEHARRLSASESISRMMEVLEGVTQALQSSPLEVGQLFTAIVEAQRVARELGSDQVVNDLNQIMLPFQVQSVGSVRAEEFDDPLRLMRMGTEPTETCQSWKKGQYNEALLAYVADGDKKGLNVIGEDGQVLLRCISRITESRVGFNDPMTRSLVLEPPYTTIDHPAVYLALAKLVLLKAQKLKASLDISGRWPPEAIQMFRQEAEAHGFTYIHSEQRSIRLSESINKYNYSDIFSGRLEPTGEFRDTTFTRFTPA